MAIYRFKRKPDRRLASTSSAPDLDVPWTMGQLHQRTLHTPIDCPLNSRAGATLPDFFESDIPLFSNRLVEILSQEGVDNLQIYDARLIRPDGSIIDGFKAVNIVGLVACADLSKSDYDPEMKPPLMSFSELVVNHSMVKDNRFFRLFEDSLQILVVERIKQAVESAGLVGIEFLEIPTN